GGRGDHPLRPHPAQPSRHLRHQRAARPHGEGPGGPLQPDGGARRPDQGLSHPPSARRGHRRQRQPGGLHEPRAHHHAAEGSLRRADPHPLPAHPRGRDRHHGAGGHAHRPRRARAARAAVHEGAGGAGDARGTRLERDQPELGRERAGQHQQLRDPDLQRGEARAAHRRARDRAPPDRPARGARLDGRQDRARVRRRGQEGRGPRRSPDQPSGPGGVGSLPLGGGARTDRRPLRSRMGRRGVGPDALRGVPRGRAEAPGAARGGGAARAVREPGAHGGGDRAGARGAAPAPAAEQGPRRGPLGLPRLMLVVRYTAWDGTQQVRLTAEQVFDKLSEYLSYTDDVQQALDWLRHQGLELEGIRVLGLDDLLEELREAMRARYREVNLRGALAEMREKLEDLLDLERETLDGLDDRERAARKRSQLDQLPARLSDALAALADYGLESGEAEALYEALRDELENIRAPEEFDRRCGDLCHGQRSLSYAEALELMREMEAWKRLEEQLLGGNLDTIDASQLGELLGPGALRSFQLLQGMMRAIAQAGYVTQREGRAVLSPKGVRRIGHLALRDIY